ncbi:MAG: carbohydrate ABC transporter permease [Eubacteriales bacterium]|nr:carbohydrate ABC transporter permease [Eubacteriales bacterium]
MVRETGLIQHLKQLKLKRRHLVREGAILVKSGLILALALVFVFPIVMTVLNSFMSSEEIVANYGMLFDQARNPWEMPADPELPWIAPTAHFKLIPDLVSAQQYIEILFKSTDYLVKFWNSVFLVLPIVAGQIFVGALAAYAFTRFRGRLAQIAFFAYIILMLMPFQVTLVPNYIVAEWFGLIDNPLAIILPGIFSTFSVFLITKYMRRIPRDYIEVAQLDGAGHWAIFSKILLPMCRTAVYSLAVLVFIDFWNMVEQPIIFLSDPLTHPLSVFLVKVNEGDIGLAFAASTIYMIPALLMFFHGEQYLVEGITHSGLKG